MPQADYRIVEAARRLRDVALKAELPHDPALKAAVLAVMHAVERYEQLDQPKPKRHV